MAKPGKQFEEAVSRFVKELDPRANVQFDLRVRDRDTGGMRQVDGWAEYELLGHRVSILISCKDHSRPLDVTEIESFLGEKASTGATTGVLYSRSAFTENAVKKAQAHQVACCRFFDNAPPERPSELLLDIQVAYPVHSLSVEPRGTAAPAEIFWSDILDRSVALCGIEWVVRTVVFQNLFSMVPLSFAHKDSAPGGPPDMLTKLDFPESSHWPAFRLNSVLAWVWFKGRLDALRLKGALNVGSNQFQGTVIAGPVPCTPPSGTAWERCDPPGPTVGTSITIWAAACPSPAMLHAALAKTSLFAGGPWTFELPTMAQLEANTLAALLSGSSGPPAPPSLQLTLQYGKQR